MTEKTETKKPTRIANRTAFWYASAVVWFGLTAECMIGHDTVFGVIEFLLFANACRNVSRLHHGELIDPEPEDD